ncbi:MULTISPECIES: hypothetical protein [Actinomadura]|uniref:Uncharacterized protein n=1 Tax=Actinomadura litoris TaxID=2678616 RepID=A0A7K1L1N5_9ACTN|nr:MULTISPECIES: hypothetical protein [Actinomadura]MBT2206687.1 hypothetical protein [Actinomadura sp. NEAU-AAG7]MUN38213.1 hypothetical protein [Actinomadura litoris]
MYALFDMRAIHTLPGFKEPASEGTVQVVAHVAAASGGRLGVMAGFNGVRSNVELKIEV